MRLLGTCALAALLLGCAPDGLFLNVSSAVDGIDELVLSTYGDAGALTTDQRLRGPLPGRVRLDAGERRHPLRVSAWGLRAGVRAAFGTVLFTLEPGRAAEVELRLEAPPADGDGDGVPDPYDVCPTVANPGQTMDGCAAASCPGNLLVNGDLEGGTVLWRGAHGSVARAMGGQAGSGFSLEICRTETLQQSSYYSVVVADVLAGPPPAGVRYRLAGWVRTAAASDLNVAASLKEQDASSNLVAESEGPRLLAQVDWGEAAVSHLASGDPRSGQLDVYFVARLGPEQSCYRLDDVCLRPVTP